MAESEQIVAIGLLTRNDLHVLGTGFRRIYPVDSTTDFDDLLRALDHAEKRRKDTTECKIRK